MLVLRVVLQAALFLAPGKWPTKSSQCRYKSYGILNIDNNSTKPLRLTKEAHCTSFIPVGTDLTIAADCTSFVAEVMGIQALLFFEFVSAAPVHAHVLLSRFEYLISSRGLWSQRAAHTQRTYLDHRVFPNTGSCNVHKPIRLK